MKKLPVDVICVCSAGGELRPLRLRMEDEEHQLFRVDVDEVLKCEETGYVGTEAQLFLCSATVRQRKWLFELQYAIRSHSWFFLRRLR